MIRLFVLLLLLPSLLMPPGMCVCQIARLPNASTSEQNLPSASHAAAPRPGCSCDSCRARADETNRGDDQPGRKPFERGEHWPGCPAAVGAVVFEFAGPVVAVSCDLLTADALSAPIELTVIAPGRVPVKVLPAAAPPLFISHCALLI